MGLVNFQDKLQDALSQIDQLTTLVSQLQQGIAAASPLPSLPAGSSPGIPIAVPELYNGDPDRCWAFLMQCGLYINHNQEMFLSNTDRACFFISL